MHIDRLPDDYCKDVGLPIGSMSRCGGVGIDELQAFAAQVAEKAAAKEREACAEICRHMSVNGAIGLLAFCAASIRARGAKEVA